MSRAPRIAIVDYQAGNVRSVQKAIEAGGGRAEITGDPGSIDRADGEAGLQREMFTVGAELATTPGKHDQLESSFSAVTAEMVEQTERDIDDLDGQIDLPNSFIIPGASAASGALDVARTTLRRAERRVVALSEEEPFENPEVLRYLNRISDLLFMLARYEDRSMPFERLTGEKE